ncbi:MAG: hypothetical protein QOF01_5026 [Thermomicrobiales bacterium]|nr:hypothetical protein [Thermomicrobiales bacterium]
MVRGVRWSEWFIWQRDPGGERFLDKLGMTRVAQNDKGALKGHGEAAIDGEDVAGDVAGVVGGEEKDGGGDL